MSEAHISLTWDAFQGSMCNGFSKLQQNGEFVDMTLAADGHLVKVHKMIVGLASPYLRELIHTAACPHPVIFLNNVSHELLCNILEYVYTGEVVLTPEKLPAFCETAKALRIKGLETMVQQVDKDNADETGIYICSDSPPPNGVKSEDNSENSMQLTPEQIEVTNLLYPGKNLVFKKGYTTNPVTSTNEHDDSTEQTQKKDSLECAQDYVSHSDIEMDESRIKKYSSDPIRVPKVAKVQYTVSNQGSLQVILNRYVYYLKYTGKQGIRHWRCVDYVNNQCPADLRTDDNLVVQRSKKHNHSFHDHKILRKLQQGVIFDTIYAAEAGRKAKRTKPREG